MTNPYVPTNVRVEDFASGALILDWDVATVLENDSKSRYNVWGSNDDGSTWDLILDHTVRSEGSIANDWKWIAVSSIHPTLGESAKSTPLKLQAPETLSESEEHVAVGQDSDGNFHFLKVASDGGLILGEGISVSIDTTYLSKEAKQDALIALNTTILDAINNATNLVSKEAKQDAANALLNTIIADLNTFAADNGADLTAIQTQLDSALAKLDSIDANVAYYGRALLRQEFVLTSVDSSGARTTVPWSEKSIIDQITVIKESGSATDFTVEVFNKAVSNSERNVIVRSKLSEGFTSTRLDFLSRVPYINLDGNDEVTIKVTPNNGTSNNFFVSINGERTH